MRLVYTENMHALMLPSGHKFPIGKYDRIYSALASRHPSAMLLGARASTADLALVHDRAWIDAIESGTADAGAIRRLGFPWSESLVLRAMRSVGGTLAALDWAMETGAAGHIAGGTHHAFRDRGEGFCTFNDIAVAIAVARRDHGVRRAAVVDLDVHQGNGTASIFEGDASVLTVSLHGARNYPFRKARSSLDVPLDDGCDDATYLRALDEALEHVRAFRPELLFFQSGVDTLAGDRLGRMALSHEGLRRRNERVFSLASSLAVPLVTTLGGGYGRDVERTIGAHVDVYEGLMDHFA